MALTESAPGATPLRPEDLAGLKLPTITTHAALNEAEAANIIAGQEWALGARRRTAREMLVDDYVQELHVRMYGDVWRWAGTYRLHETNIGCAPHEIRLQLRDLFDDACTWIEHGVYPPDELAVRIHHRLVLVHPFANGNGRHARLFADLLLMRHYGLPRLPWGGGALGNADPRREEYIAALRAADARDPAPLIAFATGRGHPAVPQR